MTLIESVNECWRILRPGGQLRLKVPHWQHDNAYADPTHRWRFSMRSFDVFVPDTKLGKELGFYTERKWQILEVRLNKERSGVIATLEVRK